MQNYQSKTLVDRIKYLEWTLLFSSTVNISFAFGLICLFIPNPNSKSFYFLNYPNAFDFKEKYDILLIWFVFGLDCGFCPSNLHLAMTREPKPRIIDQKSSSMTRHYLASHGLELAQPSFHLAIDIKGFMLNNVCVKFWYIIT